MDVDKPREGICAVRPQQILGDRAPLKVIGLQRGSPELECLSVYLADEGGMFEFRMMPGNESR